MSATPKTASPALTPMFKWTGGKRREIKHFSPFLPSFIQEEEKWRYVEPFAGGAALYWHFANPNSHINDWDEEVTNFYRVAATGDANFRQAVSQMEAKFQSGHRDAIASEYYVWRDLDRNGGLAKLPDWKRAARFFIVNQLAFSGMRRFNAAGEFNVPFGHYKTFSGAVTRSEPHKKLLAATTISQGDYATVLTQEDNDRTFVFIDPPYTRVMKKYSAGNSFGDKEQYELRDNLYALKHASWMVVIDESHLTKKLYNDTIRGHYEVTYNVNIKNRFDQGARHIVACNYEPPKIDEDRSESDAS